MNHLALLLLASGAWAAPDYGILLMAHGGAPAWNKEVDSIRKELARTAPTEVALGMADPAELQSAVDRLEKARPRRIVAVPLFVSSVSEVLDHTRYVLGLSETPSEVLREGLERMAQAMAAAGHARAHHAHAFSLERVKVSVPLVMTPALDDDPLVEDILLERARALSREPRRETLVLVGHGPVDARTDEAWLAVLGGLAGRLKSRAGLRAAKAATLRDDAPPQVKEAAAARLRALVAAAGKEGGRALVVPYLIARGGVEDHIVSALEGLPYAWDGRTICPHPNVAKWAAKRAAAAGGGKTTTATTGEKR